MMMPYIYDNNDTNIVMMPIVIKPTLLQNAMMHIQHAECICVRMYIKHAVHFHWICWHILVVIQNSLSVVLISGPADALL